MHFPVRNKVKAIWRTVPLLLFWAIWKENNKIIFEDVTFSPLRLKLSVIQSLLMRVGFIPKTDIDFDKLLLYKFYGYAYGVIFCLGWFVWLIFLSNSCFFVGPLWSLLYTSCNLYTLLFDQYAALYP